MRSSKAALAEKLEGLRSEYKRSLIDLSAQLAKFLMLLRAGELSEKHVKLLGDEAHQLAGSAGTYGLHAVGKSARQVEKAAKGEKSSTRNQAIISHLEMLISDITDLDEEASHANAVEPNPFQDIPEQPASSVAAKVLIAEDNSITQDLLKLVLVRNGHQVTIVSNGEEALKALQEDAYDVALLDFHMPKMDGLDVVDAFDNGGVSHPRPKFIAITADIEGLLSHEKNCENFDEVVPKPVDLNQICSVIEDNNHKAKQSQDELSNALSPVDRLAMEMRADDELTPLFKLGYSYLRWPRDINPNHLSARTLQAVIRNGKFDAILIEDCQNPDVISTVWNIKHLHLLPVIDCTGRLSDRADCKWSSLERDDITTIRDTIESFSNRRSYIHDDLLFTDEITEKILGRIYVGDTALAPFYDARSKSLVSYNSILSPQIIELKVNELIEKGFLKTKFFDRVHSCGSCHSSLFNVREECPQCRSSDLQEESYIHHFSCAYQGPESDFRTGDDLICPKCRKELRHFGHDYDRPGIMTKCNSCGHATSEPMVGFLCLSCGTQSDGDTIETRDIFSYELTEHAISFLEGGKAYLGFSQQTLRFSELPFDLIISLNEEARTYNQTQTPFALLEFKYANERAIQRDRGARDFNVARSLFLENLRNILGDSAKVVEGRVYDFALITEKHANDARENAQAICDQAAKDLKIDLGVTASVFGPEDLY